MSTQIKTDFGNRKTKKEKILNYTVRYFKHDTMLDTMLTDLIDFYREFRMLNEIYGCMNKEYIPTDKQSRIEMLKIRISYLSDLMLS